MLRFIYSDSGFYRGYRMFRFMYSDGGLYIVMEGYI